MYGSNPGRPPGNRRNAKINRTTVTSILKYVAIARQTPATTLPCLGLISFFI